MQYNRWPAIPLLLLISLSYVTLFMMSLCSSLWLPPSFLPLLLLLLPLLFPPLILQIDRLKKPFTVRGKSEKMRPVWISATIAPPTANAPLQRGHCHERSLFEETQKIRSRFIFVCFPPFPPFIIKNSSLICFISLSISNYTVDLKSIKPLDASVHITLWIQSSDDQEESFQ